MTTPSLQTAALISADEPRSAIAAVLEWVRVSESPPVPEAWVPGASEIERRALAALGGAVGAYWKANPHAASWARRIPEIADWVAKAPQAPIPVADAVAKVADAGADAVARLYDSIVLASARRHLGTFFTPAVEAAWMVKRWKHSFETPDAVVDVGAGVGVFTSAAFDAWPDAELFPIDINPITLGLITLLPPQGLSTQLSPVLDDFAAWATRSLPEVVGRRLILGNPPYTRLQLIPVAQRRALREAAQGLCGARASLSTLMLGASLSALGQDDGICLLLPAQWLESDYAVRLRHWLWDESDRKVELHLFDSRLFPDAKVDAVALFVGPARSVPQPLLIGNARRTAGQVTSKIAEIHRVDDSPKNWRRLFHAEMQEQQRSGRALSTFATIRRGVATGANSFFTLSDLAAKTWELPQSVLRPYVQRARDHDGSHVTSAGLAALGDAARRYMLILPRMGPHDESTARYLEYGQSLGIHGRYLTMSRSPWFSLQGEVHVPDVIVAASGRSKFSLLENSAGAVIANNLYGLHWHRHVALAERHRILQWLRSDDGQAAILQKSRRQAQGLRKLEISAWGEVDIPDQVTGQEPGC